MAETFNVAEFVIPGTYVRVRAEGLIGAGGISTGNIGIVGTARNATVPINYNETFSISDFAAAQAILGPYDAYANGAGKLNLLRGLEILLAGGRAPSMPGPGPGRQ